jgi:RNA polymerase sigma-70 factor (ECF subfamily)
MGLLVDRYHADVYRFLRQLTRHRQEAEDLAQQTLLKAIRKADQYSGRAPLKSWILGVAYREFTGWRRRRLWLPLFADQPEKRDPHSEIAEADALLKALSRLSDPLRATFLMHYVEELSIAEVAAALEISEGTVKSRLYNSRAQLRAHLTEEDPYVVEPC